MFFYYYYYYSTVINIMHNMRATLNLCAFVLGSVSPVQATTQPQRQVNPQVRPQAKPKAKKQQHKAKTSQKSRGRRDAQVWVEGRTGEGHTYYYNTLTGGRDYLKTPLRPVLYANNVLTVFYTMFFLLQHLSGTNQRVSREEVQPLHSLRLIPFSFCAF